MRLSKILKKGKPPIHSTMITEYESEEELQKFIDKKTKLLELAKMQSPKNPPIYLYHLTPKALLGKVLKEGLKINQEYRVIQNNELLKKLKEGIGEEGLEEIWEDELKQLNSNENLFKRYHVETKKEFLDKLLMENWYEYADKYDVYISSETARDSLIEHLPIQKDALFFFKEIPDRWNKDYAILRIRADKIKCRGYEADLSHSNSIFYMYASQDDDYPDDFQTLYDEIAHYYNSLRLLDIHKNNYEAEIMIHCDIPPETIEILDINPSEEKAIEKERKVNLEIIKKINPQKRIDTFKMMHSNRVSSTETVKRRTVNFIEYPNSYKLKSGTYVLKTQMVEKKEFKGKPISIEECKELPSTIWKDGFCTSEFKDKFSGTFNYIRMGKIIKEPSYLFKAIINGVRASEFRGDFDASEDSITYIIYSEIGNGISGVDTFLKEKENEAIVNFYFVDNFIIKKRVFKVLSSNEIKEIAEY